MSRHSLLALVLITFLAACAGPRELRYDRPANVRPPVFTLDHAWITMPTGGERVRTMLEAAGFRLGPTITRQDAQGIASTTIAFENGYFELISAVPASSDGAGARQRGESPLGIGFRRTAATPSPFPFETWRLTREGGAIELLSPIGAPTVTLLVASPGVDVEGNRAAIAAGGAAAERFAHPNEARRLTGVKVSAPTRAGLPPAASFVNRSGAAELVVGTEWLMELELDFGAQNREVDLRPNLPLIVRF